ncbi:MAG: ATP-dependent DNA ligase [archaeon]
MRFSEFTETLERIEREPSRNAMVSILSEFFGRLETEEVRGAVYLLQGVVEPPFKGIEFGIGEKLLVRALAISSGRSDKVISAEYRKLGDLGLVAEKFSESGRQRSLVELEKLGLSEVYSVLRNLAGSSGTGSQDDKIRTLAGLLGRCRTPAEAKHLARVPLGKLRLGIGDPTILDALSFWKSGDKSLRGELEGAYNMCSDLGLVAEKFSESGLEGVSALEIFPGNPIRPALAERLESGAAIIGKIGACLVEAKYDGFRAQVHKKGSRIEIFSRSLERTTEMFPEIVDSVRKLPASEVIFEGEAIGTDEKGNFLPFQKTIRRKRKYGVKEASEKSPLKLFAFDLLYLDGTDYTKQPFSERRKKIEALFSNGGGIAPSEAIPASTGEDIDEFFQKVVSRGLEGIIAKKLDSPYSAGARKFAWIKMKKSYTEQGLSDTVDAVIIGYFRGKGQRTNFGFGGLLVAVLDEKEGIFKSIAKVGTGFSEEGMKAFSELLEKSKSKEKPKNVESGLVPDFWVSPRHVVTVAADEITRSPTHSAGGGFALRFPRIKGFVREDKLPGDATTVSEIMSLFEIQERTRKGER